MRRPPSLRSVVDLKSTLVAMALALMVLTSMTIEAAPGQFNPRWVPVRVPAGAVVDVPTENWTNIASMANTGGGMPDIRLLQGQRWIVFGRDEIGMLGLESVQMSAAIKQLAAPVVQVLAHYSAENARLRIHLVRLERRPDGRVYLSTGDFTPHHGELYRAYRQFLTPAERAAGREGYNPFRRFRGANDDPVFYNIAPDAALVAIGHAMRIHRAATAWLAMAQQRFDVRTESRGNLFRRTVTTIVEGYVRPRWFLVAPVQVSPEGGLSAQICVDPSHVVRNPANGATTCDAAEHVAHAGVVASEWTGGNLPEAEQMLDRWEQTDRGFTVFTYALAASGLLNASATNSYALINTVFGSGGSLTQAQDGFLGSTGDGHLSASAPASEQQRTMNRRVAEQHITPTPDGGLAQTRRLYTGNCVRSASGAACIAAGQDPGMVSRVDGYAERSTSPEIAVRYLACRAAGWRGGALQQCAARWRSRVVGAAQ